MVSPTARREAVGWLQTRGTSQRRACRIVGLSRATWQYERRVDGDNAALLARLHAHAAVRPRFGYRRLHVLIAREGVAVNHKRVYRLYRVGPQRKRQVIYAEAALH
jgi:putative transposase